MTLVFFWLLCGIVAAMIGAKKGEGCLSFIAGIAFGPFGILFAIIGKGNRKTCPYCKELIHKDAKICPHCQKEQEIREIQIIKTIAPLLNIASTQDKLTPSRLIITYIIMGLGIFLGVMFIVVGGVFFIMSSFKGQLENIIGTVAMLAVGFFLFFSCYDSIKKSATQTKKPRWANKEEYEKWKAER